jgi:uncharacterized RDD family membrane protein YckC
VSPATPPDDTIDAGPRQVVQSVDAVALELPVAGPTSRMLAYALDATLLYGGLFTAGVLFVLLLAPGAAWLGEWADWLFERLGGLGDEGDLGSLVWLPFVLLYLVSVFAETLYFVGFEMAAGGRSPGKRLVGLQVLCDGGLPLTLTASLTRNLLRLADALPSSYLAGFVSMLVSREGKRLGDLVAGTVVVRHDRGGAAPPLAVDAADDDVAFALGRAHVEALGRDGRSLVRQTLRRLDALSEDQRELALERSVTVLCERIGYAEHVDPQDRAAFLRALWRASRRR